MVLSGYHIHIYIILYFCGTSEEHDRDGIKSTELGRIRQTSVGHGKVRWSKAKLCVARVSLAEIVELDGRQRSSEELDGA